MGEYINGVSPLLLKILTDIMSERLFMPFRLVGGTNLAIRYNHRVSTDIDLFTDAPYGSLRFNEFEKWMQERYPYFEPSDTSSKVGMGRTYFVGRNIEEAVKLDLIYEGDPFLFPAEEFQTFRMASLEEIGVMKLDAVFYGGRKKDFWDLHYILVDRGLSLAALIKLHEKRYPYQHERLRMIACLQDFTRADEEPDPICNLGKSWDMVKLDILDFVAELQ
ncbi:MAG: nucleotidyl transferase AbiEii/AbiGii toxin family protein [Muribaculaceae bacterium]|nr:nucleotidyl transferase AbiEii/AbiGii toxin family protein [Muribaculaceae bacterium]